MGYSVDLDRAAMLVREASDRSRLPVHRRRSAAWLMYEPPPLRVRLTREPIRVGEHETETEVECTLFDFGALSVRYRIPLDCGLHALPALSDGLYENDRLLEDSLACARQICDAVGPAITRPALSPHVEDYAVFSLESWPGPESLEGFIASQAGVLAQILCAEPQEVSAQQITDLLAGRVSFGAGDAVLASWETALVLDNDPTDVLTVLEHVNVELLEMRVLDGQLDRVLDAAYRLMQSQDRRKLWPHGPGSWGIRSLATAQMDAAILFESVTNAIKLMGDQHLARVYKLVAGRVHLREWDAGIRRKLDTAESIHQKLTQFETTRRMELLEIIIVLLIFISIVLPFLPFGPY